MKVNPKSVVVRAVEVVEGSQRRFNDAAEPFPALVEEGDVTKPYGEPERYALVGTREDGSPIYRNGSISVTVGRSVKITDYRF